MPTASGGLTGDESSMSKPEEYLALGGDCKIDPPCLFSSSTSDLKCSADLFLWADLDFCIAASESSTSLRCLTAAASSKDQASSRSNIFLEEHVSLQSHVKIRKPN